MTRRRRSQPKQWHWRSDEDIRAFVFLAVIVYVILNAVASCALGPVADGEPDIYEPAALRSVSSTAGQSKKNPHDTGAERLSET